MTFYLWTIIVLNVLGIIGAPQAIGKERKPVTAGGAALSSLIYTAILVFATVALLRGWSA